MPTEILTGLWIGNRKDAIRKQFLIDKQILCKINCTKELPENNILGIEEIRIPVSDTNKRKYERDNNQMYQYLFDITNFIYNKIHKGNNVLVYCYAGKQRSATIIAAFLIRYGKVSPNKAVEYIKTKSDKAFLSSINFYPALQKFCNELI